MHVPYMTGGREGRQRDSGRQGVKVRKKETVTRKMKEKSGWNERKGADVGFAKILCGREERMRPGTCGSRPHPISPHYIISLISITSHASFSPFHLLIEVLHGLGENRERERKREGGRGSEWLQTWATHSLTENGNDIRRNRVLEASLSFHVSQHFLLLSFYF